MLTDAAELMDCRPGADVRVILDADVAAKRGVRPEDRVAADVTVVRDVHVGHEQVVVADRRFTAAAMRAAVDGDEFPEDVLAADLETSALAAILLVLRREPDRSHRKDLRVVANLGPAID